MLDLQKEQAVENKVTLLSQQNAEDGQQADVHAKNWRTKVFH